MVPQESPRYLIYNENGTSSGIKKIFDTFLNIPTGLMWRTGLAAGLLDCGTVVHLQAVLSKALLGFHEDLGCRQTAYTEGTSPRQLSRKECKWKYELATDLNVYSQALGLRSLQFP